MKVVVLGAGVVGVATAYYLARAGAKVTVLDRNAGPALDTSFANAGQISYGYSTPWGAPGIPTKAVKWMFEKHAPLAIRLDGSAFQLSWMSAMLYNCSPERYAINKERMLRVSNYSRACLAQLRADTGIQFEQRSQGTLQLFRSQKQVDQAQRDMEVLKECGIAYELLDRAGVCQAEPALAQSRATITGGLRLPADETGDCFLFTNALAKLAEGLGVEFRWNVEIDQLTQAADGSISGVRLKRQDGGQDGGQNAGQNGTQAEVVTADRYVLALGSFSRPLLQSTGLELPIYPVKGYSLTIPIVNEALAPVSTVLDETYKIALTRFDQRIRVGGMAELGGFDRALRPARRATLEMVTNDLFPGGDLPKAEFWTGLRPMTPDSTPIIGKTPIANLYLNTGHGTLGWTMSCGSGKLLADILLGQPTDIATDGLSVERYMRAGKVCTRAA